MIDGRKEARELMENDLGGLFLRQRSRHSTPATHRSSHHSISILLEAWEMSLSSDERCWTAA